MEGGVQGGRARAWVWGKGIPPSRGSWEGTGIHQSKVASSAQPTPQRRPAQTQAAQQSDGCRKTQGGRSSRPRAGWGLSAMQREVAPAHLWAHAGRLFFQ